VLLAHTGVQKFLDFFTTHSVESVKLNKERSGSERCRKALCTTHPRNRKSLHRTAANVRRARTGEIAHVRAKAAVRT
jgi:hypothetical protein